MNQKVRWWSIRKTMCCKAMKRSNEKKKLQRNTNLQMSKKTFYCHLFSWTVSFCYVVGRWKNEWLQGWAKSNQMLKTQELWKDKFLYDYLGLVGNKLTPHALMVVHLHGRWAVQAFQASFTYCNTSCRNTWCTIEATGKSTVTIWLTSNRKEHIDWREETRCSCRKSTQAITE